MWTGVRGSDTMGAMRHDIVRRAIMDATTPTNTNFFITPEGFAQLRVCCQVDALLCLHSDQAVDRPDQRFSEDVLYTVSKPLKADCRSLSNLRLNASPCCVIFLMMK